MNARIIQWITLIIVLMVALPVSAQSGGDYTLTWSTIDGGGGRF